MILSGRVEVFMRFPLLVLIFMSFLGSGCKHRNSQSPDIASRVLADESGREKHRIGFYKGILKVPSGANPNKLVDRHHILYVPPSYNPARPTPLLFHLVGHRVSIFFGYSATELMRTADLNGFIVVFPEQEWRTDPNEEERWAWWTDWDWKNKAAQNPDFAYFRQLIDDIAAQVNIDRRRIYTTGQSRGAAMSLILAMEMRDVFAAAALHSGFMERGYDERLRSDTRPGRPPLYMMHGVADTDVKVDQSDTIVSVLRGRGWTDNELIYHRLENVGHRWQPQLNQEMWDFFAKASLPE